ncbi:MAG: hypothetical protein E6H99_00930 [Chloroflexi bacterium]|nr:MAG: hypothetical protein E6H99_00930 [Chloroflexota bacterium]
MIKVAVMMSATIRDGGGFLAEVRALEAAGAEMIGLDGDGPEHQIIVGRGRVVVGEPEGETWVKVPIPPDKSAWAATLADQEAAGATGIIVAWDPRLVDLLRNPEPDDRSDLLMSTG